MISKDKPKPEAKQKTIAENIYDWLNVISKIASIVTVIIAGIVGYDFLYRERETRVSEIQALKEIVPYLIISEQDKRADAINKKAAAIVTLHALQDEFNAKIPKQELHHSLAINLAQLTPEEGSIEALQRLVLYSNLVEIRRNSLNALESIGVSSSDYTDDVYRQLQAINTRLNYQQDNTIATAEINNINKLQGDCLKKIEALDKILNQQTKSSPVGSKQNRVIIVGSDRTLNSAKYEKEINTKRLKKIYPEKKVDIYQGSSWYFTAISNFEDEDAAKNFIEELKKKNFEFSYGSSIVNVEKLCPFPKNCVVK